MPKADRFSTLHRLLATVEPSADYDLEPLFEDVEDRWRVTSEVVFVLLTWDRTYGRLVELAAKAGCHTTVLLIGGSDAAVAHSPTPGRIDDGSAIWAEETAVLSPRDILEGRVSSL